MAEIPDFTFVDRLLANAVEDRVVPGLVAAIARGPALLYEAAYGLRAANDAQAMARDTIFWIASMTKLVTTIAAMQLVEAGELDLDAPVSGLLPELAAPQVLDRGGTSPARTAITLRHLLTHTSGIGYELMNPALLAARGPAGPPHATSLASLEGPLAHEPGEGWSYGYGIDWAGIIVERLSGKSLDRYLADSVFGPLGMNNTGFVPPVESGIAATHFRDGAGGFAVVPSPVDRIEDFEFYSGGGGLFGTVGDYIRLLRMMLERGELDGVRILRAETVDAMWDNQVGDLAAGRLDTTNPALIVPYDPVPGQRCGWSLMGLCNPAPISGARRAGSASWGGLAGTFFWIDREADLCGVLAAQLFPFADPALFALQQAFERAAYSATARLAAA